MAVGKLEHIIYEAYQNGEWVATGKVSELAARFNVKPNTLRMYIHTPKAPRGLSFKKRDMTKDETYYYTVKTRVIEREMRKQHKSMKWLSIRTKLSEGELLERIYNIVPFSEADILTFAKELDYPVTKFVDEVWPDDPNRICGSRKASQICGHRNTEFCNCQQKK